MPGGGLHGAPVVAAAAVLVAWLSSPEDRHQAGRIDGALLGSAFEAISTALLSNVFEMTGLYARSMVVQ